MSDKRGRCRCVWPVCQFLQRVQVSLTAKNWEFLESTTLCYVSEIKMWFLFFCLAIHSTKMHTFIKVHCVLLWNRWFHTTRRREFISDLGVPSSKESISVNPLGQIMRQGNRNYNRKSSCSQQMKTTDWRKTRKESLTQPAQLSRRMQSLSLHSQKSEDHCKVPWFTGKGRAKTWIGPI